MNDLLDTSKRIFHVYLCNGQPAHVSSGFRLLVTGKGLVCPDCGETVKDVTKERIGREYFAFARPDLGVRQ